MKILIIPLCISCLNGMELIVLGSGPNEKRYDIKDEEVIAVIKGIEKKHVTEDPILAMGTGGNSGGNVPPPISYWITDGNPKVIWKFYEMFHYVYIGDSCRLMTPEEQKILQKFADTLGN